MSKTVLVTGAEGLIGAYLSTALESRYTVRRLTRAPLPGLPTVVADITDMEAMEQACQGIDAIVHLAGSSAVESTWNDVLHNNIIGTYTVFEAAHRAGVQQIIFASSNHAVGGYEMEKAPDIYRRDHASLTQNTLPRPDSLYGVSKCFGESLGRFYADQHGMRVICLRIGTINREDSPTGASVAQMNPWLPSEALRYERARTTWQSKRDFAQMVERCLEATHVRFDIFYGISNNPHRFMDIEHARQVIGYSPLDSSSDAP